MQIRGWLEARAKLVFMGGLLLAPPQHCTGGGGGGGGGAAGTAGQAGAAGAGGSSAGATSGGSGGAESAGSGGTGGGAPEGEGGAAGDGGSQPVACPEGAFGVVGETSCFECPGYIYEPYATTCATLASDSALHHYDAATHQVRLRAGDGFPVPQPGWQFYDVSPSFDTEAHRLACNARPVYSVDGLDYVIDVSSYAACEGLTDLVMFDLFPNYGCAHGLSNSTYVSLHFEGGAPSLHLDCFSPNNEAPVVFGGLVPFPRPVRFDASDPAAVKDNETGLVWQQLADGSYPSLSQAEAVGYCDSLEHAGADDWRLPSAGELFSLSQLQSGAFNHHDPAAFPNSPADTFWSASQYALDLTWGWTVFFGYYGEPFPGAVPFVLMYDLGEFAYHVRCVRAGVAPSPRYTDNQDGTVLDNSTGRVWEKSPTLANLTPREAQDYCRHLELAGGGWRMPTLGELVGIADYTQWPAYDYVFESAPNRGFSMWSSSPWVEASPGSGGWTLYEDGMAYPMSSTEPLESPSDVRCVR